MLLELRGIENSDGRNQDFPLTLEFLDNSKLKLGCGCDS